MNDKTLISDLMHFIEASPASYQAVDEIAKALEKERCEKLALNSKWQLKAGKKYFVVNGGALIAFQAPQKTVQEAVILASHTDSPSLKLKPNAEYVKEGLAMLGVEVYGGPLLNSWLNRDLGIAGKVLFTDTQHRTHEALVNLTQDPVTVPQLAIHLDRKVNDEGLQLNKQEHLNAVAGIYQGQSKEPKFLEKMLQKLLPVKELLAHDLFLYPLEKPSLVGQGGELLAAYRLDALAAVHAIYRAFLSSKTPSATTLKMIAFWDNEEIGSQTSTGAESPFFSNTLERILYGLKLNREDYLRLLSASLCVSVDLAHAIHPNYPERHDPQHKLQLGKGVVLKTNAQKRYATDIHSAKKVIEIASKEKCALQYFAARNDIPSGSTIGPIQATLTGIPTVDIGIAQLSMHSARELIATADAIALYNLLKALF